MHVHCTQQIHMFTFVAKFAHTHTYVAAIDSPDPWASYAPSVPDPRVLYVLHTGTISSPMPKVSEEEERR